MATSSTGAPPEVVLAQTLAQSSLSPKEKFDACMKLADFFRELWESRRGYEWKIAFGLWGLLAAATVTLRGRGGLPGYMVVVIVLVFEFGWLWNLWDRSDKEKKAGKHYRAQAEEIMIDPSHEVALYDWKEQSPFRAKIWEFATDWSMQFQLIVTLLLALAAYHFNHTR